MMKTNLSRSLKIIFGGKPVISMHRRAPLFFLGVFFLLLNQIANAQYQMEKLDRGVVAMSLGGSKVFVSWRWLGTEDEITFNLYRNGTKINATPLTVCNYTDNAGTATASYTVRAVVNGVEQVASAGVTPWAQQYMKIPLKIPAGGTTPDGVAYTYSPNDCSIGDIDGDGKHEIFVKWDPSNSKDNSQSGYTGNVFIDCYSMTGTQLWRIDLGKNIRAGAHYTQFLVYDFDGDGMAEMACKTADGTKDGKGIVIGSATADYRNTSGYILSGPEFLTVFNGKTGAAMATTNYTPARGTVSSWGDSYGNRVDRFIAVVAYLDGQHPSMVFGRGYYTRLVRSAWDWKNGQLTQRWIFDSNTSGNGSYAGMGNHQMTVGDVDGDGKQEFCNGASAINDDGKGLYANGLGHGDAMHMSDMDPDRPGQEVWQCHEVPSEYGNYGLEFRDAKTGTPLWGLGGGNNGDVGRALAADIDPRYKGYECWGSSGVLYDCKGNQIGTSKPTVNFAVYWDGDLQRELLDGNKLDKWSYSTGSSQRISSLYTDAYGTGTPCNGTKATPNLSADLFGDWREEIILHSADNSSLLIYTTPIASTYKFRTLLHDPQYRVAIAWQNAAYNQPPHLGYYLGTDMVTPAKPNIAVLGTITNQAPSINITSPVTGTAFVAPGNITITASATDADGTVSNVQFYNGTTLLGSDASAPYSFAWTNVAAGTYSIAAKATDNSGAITTSTAITVVVNSVANVDPTVSISAPLNNATFTAPAGITITASAADADGTVSSVQFYNGTTLLGSDASAPYSFAWTNVAAGTYSITAKATDNSGAVTISTAISIIVNAVTSTASIIGPDCGAINSTINFELNASERTGATSYSWWFQGYTQSIAQVVGSPYEVNIQTGPYFSGGQVCVGIAYNIAPYSNTICKSITTCSSAKISGNNIFADEQSNAVSTNVSPNPSTSSFTLLAGEDVQSFKVMTNTGTVLLNGNSLKAGQSISFGESLSTGFYILSIQYSSGRTETKNIQKIM